MSFPSGAELIALAVAGDVQGVLDRTAGLDKAERTTLWKEARAGIEALRALCADRPVWESERLEPDGSWTRTTGGPGVGITQQTAAWLRSRFDADPACLPGLVDANSVNESADAIPIHHAASTVMAALGRQDDVRVVLSTGSPFNFWDDDLAEVQIEDAHLLRAVAARPEAWRIQELDRFMDEGYRNLDVIEELRAMHPEFAARGPRWMGNAVRHASRRDRLDRLDDASLLHALALPPRSADEPLSSRLITRPVVHQICHERAADPVFRGKLVRLALEELAAPQKPLFAKSWLTLLTLAEATIDEQGSDPDAWAALATARETSVAAFGVKGIPGLVAAGHLAPDVALARLGEATWHTTGKVAIAAWKAAVKLAGSADLSAQLLGIAADAQDSKHKKLAGSARTLLESHGAAPEPEEAPTPIAVDDAVQGVRSTDTPWLAALRGSLGAPWPVRVPVQEPPFLGPDWEPLASADAVAEMMAGMPKGDFLLDQRWDFVLDGVVRHPSPGDSVRKTLSPIFAKTRKHRRQWSVEALAGPLAALEDLARVWLGDERPPTPQGQAEPYFRAQAAMAALDAGDTSTPLGTPSSAHGWLDPVVFARRVAARDPRHPIELAVALRRLPLWPARRAEARALLPEDGRPAVAAAREALAPDADAHGVADTWLHKHAFSLARYHHGWWSEARGTWERKRARSQLWSAGFEGPTDPSDPAREWHIQAPAMGAEFVEIGAKVLAKAVRNQSSLYKNHFAVASLHVGLFPSVDVAPALPDLAAGFPSKHAAHRAGILDLIDGAIGDGRLAPRAVAAALAEPLRTAAKEVKGMHQALADWAAGGDLPLAVVLMTYEGAVAAGDMDGLGRNASPLLNGLDALLGASGRALDGAEARAVIAELAGRKKANAAVKAARAIHARSATQPSLDLLAAAALLA